MARAEKNLGLQLAATSYPIPGASLHACSRSRPPTLLNLSRPASCTAGPRTLSFHTESARDRSLCNQPTDRGLPGPAPSPSHWPGAVCARGARFPSAPSLPERRCPAAPAAAGGGGGGGGGRGGRDWRGGMAEGGAWARAEGLLCVSEGGRGNATHVTHVPPPPPPRNNRCPPATAII